MAQKRPNIPESVKRQIRQRCGFGCVICGLPLYEYEHIAEWSAVKRHDPDEMTLLCPTHHAEKTRGLLPVAEVKSADQAPFNFRSGQSESFPLRYSGDSCLVSIGGSIWRHEFTQDAVVPLLVIRGCAVIEVKKQDERLLLSLRVYNKQAKPLLQIVENELVFSTSSWDVELVGRLLTIRGGSRDILVQMEFQTPDAILITRGVFAFGGAQIQVEPDHIHLPKYNIRMAGYSARGNGGSALRFD
ncbi:HNH endonuclease signature motif containing protein [Streptomyces sp. B93]|uniref:HNH endonuclease signature motif containing protein n=1 Tax=Streptomyces sp. B93 TaxID=2824875 RepID=UPI001B35B679|nr:HNH endonuclease signature motif containing protein [Streptomyces sp. B93]MBQ1091440.1 HNH endonuclease [Streptomyces sp. B93]